MTLTYDQAIAALGDPQYASIEGLKDSTNRTF